MRYIMKFVRAFQDTATSFSSRDWLMITAVMLVVGFVCMQGYGSRKKY